MEFNIVIGNPPYNRGADLDFVNLGHKLGTDHCIMIIPAKWQGTGEDALSTSNLTYRYFREYLVPFMSKVVFYPNSREVFDIALGGGISYFLIDKERPSEHLKKTVCKSNKALESDWENIDISNTSQVCLYSNTIQDIIDKCQGEQIALEPFKHTMYVADNKDKIPFTSNESDVAIISNNSILGYINRKDLYTEDGLNSYKVIVNCMRGGATDFGIDGKMLGLNKLLLAKPNQVGGGNYYVLRFFDTESESLSFISYLNTKLIRFLYFLGVYATGIRNETFKYVPEPIEIDDLGNKTLGKFNHTFTDTELYNRYNLNTAEISIIEALIKERKQ